MKCPVCECEDFYIGILTGPNCANKNCKNYKGGHIDVDEESFFVPRTEEYDESNFQLDFELDWDEDEEKTPVMRKYKYDDWGNPV